MQQKTILITNDDGIHACGIAPLAEAFTASGADVWVVAPDRERSAVSHAITLREPLRMHEIAPHQFACSGTPVDCSYMGIVHVVPRRPDLVISGINHGYNLGTDVFYSGTVGAAVEAAIRGVPAMAVSTIRGASAEHLRLCGQAVVKLARMILSWPAPRHPWVYNCNIPPDPGKVELTTPGIRHYHDEVMVRYDPKGEPYYWIGGPISPDHGNLEGGEFAALESGNISLSPLCLSFLPDAGDLQRVKDALVREWRS